MNNIKKNKDLKEEDLSLSDIFFNIKLWLKYLIRFKWLLLAISFVGASSGFVFVKYFSKPTYKASVSFTLEKSGTGGILGGMVSSLGLGDLPSGSSSGMFGGENVLYLMKSNRIIHQCLKEKQADLNGGHLLNEYLKNHFEKPLKNKKILLFPKNLDTLVLNRSQDSLLLLITKNIRENQVIAERIDKETTIINLEVSDLNEKWAFLFSKALVKNAIDLYLEIMVGKLLRTEEELTAKRDSLRGLLDGSITTLALETDLNSHTPLMRYKTNQVKKQIDVEVLKSMYANVIQNLEVTKIQRAQEEPIIEIIDEPILPLEKTKKSTFLTMIYGSILGVFLCSIVLVIQRIRNKKLWV